VRNGRKLDSLIIVSALWHYILIPIAMDVAHVSID
jgi:hypothetical protein